MRSPRPVITAAMLCLAVMLVSSGAFAAHLFVLKESSGDISIEKLDIEEGEVLELDGRDVITVLIPLGAGQSGDMVKKDIRTGTITARLEDGELKVEKKQDDGRQMSFPTVKIADLSSYDMRVNVAGGDGTKKAVMIKADGDAEDDDGPVIDMFAGMIPLEDGDYSITLEISPAEEPEIVAGEATLYYEDGFLITEGALSDGRKGWFIIDFGASGTVVEKDFLPSYVDIKEVKALEYSGLGRREVKGEMTGAGGEVTGYLGRAAPGDLFFGDVRFRDVDVNVIDSMPDFGTRKIVGILGLDLMQRCERIAFEYPRSGPGVLMMGGRHTLAGTDSPTASVRFHYVADHLFLDGEVNEVPVSFLLDTGARSSILSASKAEEAGLRETDGAGRGKLRGLDGNEVETVSVVADRLGLGGWLRSEVPFFSADLSVFESIGLRRGGGLIGNDFLDDYVLVEIDFEDDVISLWE